jgi:hypothetical protein
LTKEEALPKISGSPLHTVKVKFKDGKQLEFSIWKQGTDQEGIALKTSDNGYFLAPSQLLENLSEKPKPIEKDQLGNKG